MGAWGSEALIFLALPGVPFFLACVFFFFLACASSPARPRARRRNQKKEALGKATSAWGGGEAGGVGVWGEGRCFFLRFPVPSSLARVFSFFFLVCASHPARIGLSFFVFV